MASYEYEKEERYEESIELTEHGFFVVRTYEDGLRSRKYYSTERGRA